MKYFLSIFSIILVSACSSLPEHQLGQAANEMYDLQTNDILAANNPAEGIVNGLDGGVGENIINSHRNVDTKSESVTEDVQFDMGGGD